MLEAGVVRVMKVPAVAVVIGSCLLGQQSHSPETTRQMYYLAASPKDELPTVSPNPSSAPQPKVGATHLGFRYNLALIDEEGKHHVVSADRVLKAGDCVSIELQSNRSGYLYVLAKQSSGSWIPLIPSRDMADEKNVIDPGKNLRIPKGYCFAIHDPPGTETLFVVLSRDPKDFLELYEGIKRKGGTTATVAKSSSKHSEEKDLNTAVEQLNEKFGTRDLSVQKIPEPTEKGEARGSVYVVNSSDKPVSSIAAKIEIRHR